MLLYMVNVARKSVILDVGALAAGEATVATNDKCNTSAHTRCLDLHRTATAHQYMYITEESSTAAAAAAAAAENGPLTGRDRPLIGRYED